MCSDPAALPPSDDMASDSELVARLAAQVAPLRAQAVAKAHSSRGLVPSEVHLRANAARHQFRHSKPFDELSLRELRAAQRGRRCGKAPKVGEQAAPLVAEACCLAAVAAMPARR